MSSLAVGKIRKGIWLASNKHNRHSPGPLKSQHWEFQGIFPEIRNGEFEPKRIPKYQCDISGIEEKTISLHAREMSTRDIHD